jgi:hypothetical protein
MSVLICKCGSRLVVAKADYAKLSATEYVCNTCKMEKKQGFIGKVTEAEEAKAFSAPDGVQEVRKYGKRKGFGRE